VDICISCRKPAARNGRGINTHPEKLAVGLSSSGIFGKHYYKTGLTEAL